MTCSGHFSIGISMSKKANTNPTSKKKSNVLPILLCLLLLVLGIGIFCYPMVSNYFAQLNHAEVIVNYQEQVDQMEQAQLEQAWQQAQIYNENLAGDPVHDPFVPGSGYALPDNYLDVLNIDGDGVMGYLEIPKIDVYLPIYHGTDEESLQEGVGHMESTALPIGSVGGHSVLSGHRGLPNAELFTNLNLLEEGDYFYIHVLDETLAYQVDQITVVEPDELSQIAAIPGEDLVTLLTCTPYGVNTQRLLVRGARTEYIPPEETVTDSPNTMLQSTTNQSMLMGIGLGLGILLILVIVLWIIFRVRRKKKPLPPLPPKDKEIPPDSG